MEAIECIKGRRSIRAYTNEPVDREVINKIVEAASYAHSWKHTQTARYRVIESKELKDKIASECTHTYPNNGEIIKQAPVLVVVSFVKNRSGFERDGSFSTSKGDRWEMFDSGIATEAFCLAAHSFGLGTVIMGLFDDTVKEAIELPDNQDISCIICLGHKAEDPVAPKRKAVEDLVIYK